ncbi:MAG TPA: membrane protein insertion efficiency factor YidD [Alloacidobacterium sp.]|nr:membrane protein insertion efficiency factor YidD [Alloacidobacterium sp.]
MNQGSRFRVSLISGMHSVYKLVLSPVLHAGAGMTGGACRFQPTCSEYAAIAVHEYGWLRGGWMALKRVLRCHPASKGGFDPVPPKHPFMQSSRAPVTMKEAHISHDSRL